MRGTPLLVQMFILYYGVGFMLGQIAEVRHGLLWRHLDATWYAAVALTINRAGYSGEILRGAILAVPHGEVEAARAFGMTKWQIVRRIMLPRAIRTSLLTFSGETILLLKATSVASTITVTELLRVADVARASSFRIEETLFSAAIIYIYAFLSFVLTRAFYFAERQLDKDRLPPNPVTPAAAVPAK